MQQRSGKEWYQMNKASKKKSHIIENEECSFEIKVQAVQNETWQGRIHWIEKRQKQDFRSALEMLKLMDEAITEGENNAVAWEEKS